MVIDEQSDRVYSSNIIQTWKVVILNVYLFPSTIEMKDGRLLVWEGGWYFKIIFFRHDAIGAVTHVSVLYSYHLLQEIGYVH